jgi:hypothetical protein
VIVDDNGTYLPIGLAEALALAGRDVTILTPHAGVGGRLGPDRTAEFGWAYPRIAEAGVRVQPHSYLRAIEAGRVIAGGVWDDSETILEADTVVPVQLREARDALYHELRGAGDGDVRRIGDCVAPRELDHALFEGVREGHAI